MLISYDWPNQLAYADGTRTSRQSAQANAARVSNDPWPIGTCFLFKYDEFYF